MEWTPRLDDEVIIYPRSTRQALGRIVDDFGDGPACAVEMSDGEVIRPARRWAVQTHDGGLVFVDTADLTRVLHD